MGSQTIADADFPIITAPTTISIDGLILTLGPDVPPTTSLPTDPTSALEAVQAQATALIIDFGAISGLLGAWGAGSLAGDVAVADLITLSPAALTSKSCLSPG